MLQYFLKSIKFVIVKVGLKVVISDFFGIELEEFMLKERLKIKFEGLPRSLCRLKLIKILFFFKEAIQVNVVICMLCKWGLINKLITLCPLIYKRMKKISRLEDLWRRVSEASLIWIYKVNELPSESESIIQYSLSVTLL